MTAGRRVVARRLWSGSGVLARRVAGGAAAWVRAGRRTDIKGLRAVLGAVLRGGVLLAGVYAAARTVRAAPVLLWPLSGAWGVAAYRAGDALPEPARAPVEAAEAPPDDPPGHPAQESRVAFARWLLATIGDRPGIHLAELYPAMRSLPGQEGRDDAALRAGLRTLGVPVVRTLRLGRVAGRSGVRKTDVEALLPRTAPGVTCAGDDRSDLRESPPVSALSAPSPTVESA